MTLSITQLKKYRSRFGWVFVISCVVLLLSGLLWLADSGESSVIPPLTSETINLPTILSVASLLTSLTSLVGFIITTWIAWRRERREQQFADLDLEKVRLEVEKLRLEVARNKQESSSGSEGSSDVK